MPPPKREAGDVLPALHPTSTKHIVSVRNFSTFPHNSLANIKIRQELSQFKMADWQSISAKKQTERDALIPKEWRLPESTLGIYNKDANLGVLDVPRTCGILSAKEVELTEKYDATALLSMLASGEIR
jgi:hypothetical protein